VTVCGLILLLAGAAMAWFGIQAHAWFTLFWAVIFLAAGVDMLVFVASLVSLRRQAARRRELQWYVPERGVTEDGRPYIVLPGIRDE
jgi:hypothetical protein